MAKFGKFLLLFLVLCGCTGCAVRDVGNVVRLDDAPDSVYVTDAEVKRAGNSMMIVAVLKNTSKATRHVTYRFRWMDETGSPVGEEKPWTPRLLYAGQSVQIRSIAPAAAVRYLIDLSQ